MYAYGPRRRPVSCGHLGNLLPVQSSLGRVTQSRHTVVTARAHCVNGRFRMETRRENGRIRISSDRCLRRTCFAGVTEDTQTLSGQKRTIHT